MSLPLMLGEQIEGAAHAAEHAEAEHVDLHDLQLLEIVLLPFDHPPVDHRRRLDRDEIVEPVAGEDEAAGMLAERWRGVPISWRVSSSVSARRGSLRSRPSSSTWRSATPSFDQPQTWPDSVRGHVLGQAQRLADLAHRAAGAVAADHRGQRGMVVAVGLVDPLDHLLAPLMLEIDVDVGRLVAARRRGSARTGGCA